MKKRFFIMTCALILTIYITSCPGSGVSLTEIEPEEYLSAHTLNLINNGEAIFERVTRSSSFPGSLSSERVVEELDLFLYPDDASRTAFYERMQDDLIENEQYAELNGFL